MRHAGLLPFLLASLLVGAAGCHRASRRASVVASVFPVYDLARRIAGPDADVTLAHPDEARPEGATVVVEVGLGFDPWMDALAAPKARVLRVGDRVPTLPGAGGAAGAIDPHVWMDPQRARLIVTAIAEEMARADAAHANAFRERAAAVDASLGALDHEIDTHAAAWKTREVATDDPGMAYFAERYRVTIDAGPRAKPGEPHASLDSSGGGASDVPGEAGPPKLSMASGSYENLLRSDTAALDSALR